MKAVRWLAIAVIGALLAAAVLYDGEEREPDDPVAPLRPGVPVATGDGGTWFCPGGTNPAIGGIAGVGLEIVNAGADAAAAAVTVVTTGAAETPEAATVEIPPGERAIVSLAGLAPDAPWIGAVVETAGTDVIVEQTFAGGTGSDRSPCATRTADRWIVPFGATRVEAAGEEMVLLLLNPFPDDAIVDIEYEADVGIDSVAGLVVPANRLVAVDVTDAETGVTVASRVSALVEVTAGRIVASRVQSYDGAEARGLAVTPATPGAAVVHLPTTAVGDGRRDVVSVTNPGGEAVEVDVEIVAEGDTFPDPIELTVLPGRTVQVDLAGEARLADLEGFSLVVRSLSGEPVGASVDSVVAPGADDLVVGAASSTGVDVAADRWLVPIEGVEGETGRVVVVNPSPSAIASVEVSVVDADGSRSVAVVEIGPGRRAVVDAGELDGDRPVVVVASSSPVVAGRETAGLTSRSMATGVAASMAAAFADLP